MNFIEARIAAILASERPANALPLRSGACSYDSYFGFRNIKPPTQRSTGNENFNLTFAIFIT